MTKDELLRLMRAPEDAFLERKVEGVSRRDIRRTACAFANTVDGRNAVLFIGVNDRTGAVLGVQDTDTLQKTIRAACSEDCYPPIKHTAEVLEIEGKSVVAVIVPPSDQKPHFTGPAYVRVGSSSVNASAEQLNELVLSRNDKCREILRLRGKGLISVRAIGYRLGSKKPLADRHYVEQAECVVTECTAHFVRLHHPATGETYSEAIERIEISRDEARNRTMLIVRFP